MNDLYHLIESLLLVLLLFRTFYQVTPNSKRFNQSFVEILYFFVICLINHIWGYINPSSEYFFYFVHCAFPVVLPLSILNRNFKPLFLLFLAVIVFLNLQIRDYRIIVITYLLCLIVLSNRIVAFALLSKKYRQILPIYIAILFLIVLTNLTYLLGYFKMDWTHSQLIHYFSFIIKFVYLSTIILGHVYLRRFIVN
jgi:hypothetical protein